MRIKIGFVVMIMAFGLFTVTIDAQHDHFAATGFLQNGAGMRMVGSGATFNVDVYLNSYSSDTEAKRLAGVLREGGNDGLQKALEKMKDIGKIQLTGRVGFYHFKLIRQRPIEGGRRIVAVTDRPIQGLEAYYGSRSQDYSIGILVLDLKKNKKGKEVGEGSLIYAGKVKVIEGKSIEIETYGISPVKLMNVRKL